MHGQLRYRKSNNSKWVNMKTLNHIGSLILVLMMFSFTPGNKKNVKKWLALTIQPKAQSKRELNFPKEELYPNQLPEKNKFWIFILAGQSNMAGRGFVEPEDTIPNSQILSINKHGDWIIAKEPLHFYTPSKTGLDCGLSFARELQKHVDDSITIGIIPTAIGGSYVAQWLGDSINSRVSLYSNFKEKVHVAKKAGCIKGILWHQGESDSYTDRVAGYDERLELLVSKFRTEVGNNKLPVLMGELGSFIEFEKRDLRWNAINSMIHKLVDKDKYSEIIETKDLTHKGDFLHFDGKSQRAMGKMYALKYLELLKKYEHK